MEMKFVLGRSGSGKTEELLGEIRSKLFEDPAGSPMVLLVPDQMTFAMEYRLAKTPGLGGMMRAQVYSFTRLAWRVLQETGGMTRQYLSSTGIQMMLRKLIEENRQQLRVYAKASDKAGFVEHVEVMLTELKRYCVSVEELQSQFEDLNSAASAGEQALSGKIHDLALLYAGMEKELSRNYIDSEDYLRLLSEKIEHWPNIAETDFYIDGFYHFTPQEYQVLEQIMKHARSVTIALTADKPFDEHLPHELHLFHMTGLTYNKLTSLAQKNGLDTGVCEVRKELHRFAGSPSLAHLEKHYDSRPTRKFEQETDICLLQAANRRAEIEGIARKIQSLIRTKGFRYRDMALLVRNSGDYHDLIEQIFRDYDIPYFIDQKRSMLSHPLIELIRSSLETVTGNWRYEPVFRCIKTELLYPSGASRHQLREDADQLENYVLSYGIQGKRWTEDVRWVYRRFTSLDEDFAVTDAELQMEEKLNSMKKMIVPPLKTLSSRLKRGKTGRKKAQALYLFLEELEIPEKLEQLKFESEEAGRLVEAREHDQVWNAVISMLDEFVEMMDETEISHALFNDMIDSGLQALKFALVPPAMDQVLVASLTRSRFFDIKCSFILGANDGVLPAKPAEEGVLSEEDRELLWRSGMELAPNARQQLLDENFLIYLALTSASEELFISYPLADAEGKSLLPSVLIRRLQEIFPDMQQHMLLNEPQELQDIEQLDFMVNPSVTLTYLTSQLQAWKRNYPIHDGWWEAYNQLINGSYSSLTARLVSSLFYKNEPQRLEKEVSRELYGEHIMGSVSRMEQFQACAFSHFASHGLKLRERQFYRLEAPDIGQLFHSALKLISDRLQEMKTDWKDLTASQCERLSEDAVNRLAPRLQREILLSSNRHMYLMRKLQRIIARASSVISEHARASGFSPAGIELGFGKSEALPPIRFTLDNGCTMELAGRIDRVDKADSSKGLLLRIIDFKSSDKTLNLSEVYYGLALQMLTYLDVILTHSTEWLGVEASPAGVLYFHVHDPLINTKSWISEDMVEEEIFKKFKMKGLLLGDEEALRLMDTTLESGQSSIVSAGLKKDGSFRSDSQIASEADFSLLRNHVRKQFKQIGTDITDGVIDVAPYKIKDKVPCTFCEFKSVCQFDVSLEENQYRVLKPETNEEVLKRLKEEAEKDDEVSAKTGKQPVDR
ncbi:helicase-exonuclease AddAB subunit AddB [Bacillus lacus]|uniref:ATP-dependent helicase/deoxyribonuclease subunit B n=1 Tax=Metabacillus lacus TaxID=1983721 RepID=A0A7X2J2S9_9BACI|nr:helicase-exonuclease AddAB subunit AddB [Metabacillus lacus]MRX73528.1 helicase-exonuclease AddAB subunit AddB [Metabacillus lacus]